MKRSTPPFIWETYKFFDPREVLIQLGRIEDKFVGAPIGDRVLRLRTRGLRSIRERRQAALFCYGMSCSLNQAISYTPVEEEDFDCIARWIDNDTTHYTPIQLKELPPKALNEKALLESELAKLKKYVGSYDLVVAYYINRRQNINLSTLKIPKLNIAELWLYGSISPDNSRWMLSGNLLGTPSNFEYEYPTEQDN